MRFLNWLSSLWPFITKRYHEQKMNDMWNEVTCLNQMHFEEKQALRDYYAGKGTVTDSGKESFVAVDKSRVEPPSEMLVIKGDYTADLRGFRIHDDGKCEAYFKPKEDSDAQAND